MLCSRPGHPTPPSLHYKEYIIFFICVLIITNTSPVASLEKIMTTSHRHNKYAGGKSFKGLILNWSDSVDDEKKIQFVLDYYNLPLAEVATKYALNIKNVNLVYKHVPDLGLSKPCAICKEEMPVLLKSRTSVSRRDNRTYEDLLKITKRSKCPHCNHDYAWNSVCICSHCVTEKSNRRQDIAEAKDNLVSQHEIQQRSSSKYLCRWWVQTGLLNFTQPPSEETTISEMFFLAVTLCAAGCLPLPETNAEDDSLECSLMPLHERIHIEQQAFKHYGLYFPKYYPAPYSSMSYLLEIQNSKISTLGGYYNVFSLDYAIESELLISSYNTLLGRLDGDDMQLVRKEIFAYSLFDYLASRLSTINLFDDREPSVKTLQVLLDGLDILSFNEMAYLINYSCKNTLYNYQTGRFSSRTHAINAVFSSLNFLPEFAKKNDWTMIFKNESDLPDYFSLYLLSYFYDFDKRY